MATPTISVQPATVNGQPTIVVRSPYNPGFAPRAKALGGRFFKDPAGARWDFDPRDEERVRDLCRDIYGTDGSPAAIADTVTIRATLAATNYDRELYIAGRQVARALGRDSGARLSEGTIILSGKLDSGGSARNYYLRAVGETVIEVRDLPRAAAQRAIDEIRDHAARTQAAWRSDYERNAAACDGTGTTPRAELRTFTPDITIEIVEDAETADDVAARMGTGAENSPTEQVWAAIQALPVEAQVAIRNRLLATL